MHNPSGQKPGVNETVTESTDSPHESPDSQVQDTPEIVPDDERRERDLGWQKPGVNETLTNSTNSPQESPESQVLDTPEIVSDEPLDGQNPSVDETVANSVCKSPVHGEFYSIDELQSRGYFMKINGDVKCVTNLSLPSDAVGLTKVHCRRLPPDMTENELIPMMEKCGRILELRFVAGGVVNVTYMTDQEAINAVKMFNGQILQGRPVTVEKAEKKRLFVRPIPVDAAKADLFDYFNKLTRGLVHVYLPYSHDHPSNNRGFCYLNYRDGKCAEAAKDILFNSCYGGRTLACYWAERQESKEEANAVSGKFLTPPPYKLYVKNLRPGLTASDLRKLFSDYGQVIEVDRSGNWASVKFLHPSETKRAFSTIDRKSLGNDNVEISLSELAA